HHDFEVGVPIRREHRGVIHDTLPRGSFNLWSRRPLKRFTGHLRETRTQPAPIPMGTVHQLPPMLLTANSVGFGGWFPRASGPPSRNVEGAVLDGARLT